MHVLATVLGALACVFPATSCVGMEQSQVGQPKAQLERKSLWAATWKPVPSDCVTLTEMIFVEGQFVPGQPSAMPDPLAAARRSKMLPEGRAALHWWRYSNSLFTARVDNAVVGGVPSPTIPSPWANFAAVETRREWTEWLRQFQSAGGKLDYLIGDYEQWGGLKNWGLKPGAAATIAADPRASRPMWGAQPLSVLLQGVRLDRIDDFTNSPDYLQWNRAISTLTAAAMNYAIFEPARAMFPAVKGSNYAGMRMVDQPGPDANGHPQPWDNLFGTASAPAEYGMIEGSARAWFIDPTDPTKLSKQGTTRITFEPWFSFVTDIQQARSCRRTAPRVPLQPWVAFAHWPGTTGQVAYPSDQRYWDEMVRHFALLGTEMFNFWNPTTVDNPDTGPWATVPDRDGGARRLDRVLRDLNTRLQGVVVRHASAAPISYLADVVTSGGQRPDGTWLWRTTVRPGVIALRDRKTKVMVSLEDNSVGRWDVTAEPTAPDYEPIKGPVGKGSSSTVPAGAPSRTPMKTPSKTSSKTLSKAPTSSR